MSYCQYCNELNEDNLHKIYHDNFYGYKIDSDNELFGRLILEINQAGLSWITILKKQENFRLAYDNFDSEIIASYNDLKIKALLNDSGIVRNRLKINATIYNAIQIEKIKQEHGSFKNWLDQHHLNSLEEWVKLFKKTFKFVGGEIVKEFLMSIGYVDGAHDENCKVFQKINLLNSKSRIDVKI